jgi:multicomponent Na+:H+ antiporter subunit C
MAEPFPPSPFLIYGTTAVLLFCIGLHGLIVRRNVLRMIIGLNVMAAGVFLLFISLADRNRELFADPVPQAMVLTGIVISISATAFALALARRIRARTGRITLHDHQGQGEGD